MPTSTYKSFLMHKETGGTYKMLFPVKTIPALGAAPSTLDTTTLSDSMKTGIPDILDLGTLEFSTNYEKEYYEKLLALKGKDEGWAVWFGGTESGGVLTDADGVLVACEMEKVHHVRVEAAEEFLSLRLIERKKHRPAAQIPAALRGEEECLGAAKIPRRTDTARIAKSKRQ